MSAPVPPEGSCVCALHTDTYCTNTVHKISVEVELQKFLFKIQGILNKKKHILFSILSDNIIFIKGEIGEYVIWHMLFSFKYIYYLYKKLNITIVTAQLNSTQPQLNLE